VKVEACKKTCFEFGSAVFPEIFRIAEIPVIVKRGSGKNELWKKCRGIAAELYFLIEFSFDVIETDTRFWG
jgi:hypothetical protein